MLEKPQIFTKPIFKSGEISPDLNGLQPYLERLDWLIQHRMSLLQAEEKTDSSAVKTNESLAEPPSIQLPSNSTLAWLQKTFNLSTIDLDILVISIAPELDRCYEEYYAILQNNMSCRKPTIDMVLDLLCSSIFQKIAYRQHFATNAPLIYHNLLHLIPDTQQQPSTFLANYLVLDAQVIRLLLHQSDLDSRLISNCQLLDKKDNHIFSLLSTIKPSLITLIKQDWEQQKPLILYFQGNDLTIKRQTAQKLAQSLNIPLLVADVARIIKDQVSFEQTLQLLWREAWFFSYLLYIDNFDILYLPEHQNLYHSFLRELENNRGLTILAGTKNWIPTGTVIKGIITVPFTIPNINQRQTYWQTCLKNAKINMKDREIEILSTRFKLTQNQITDAVATVENLNRLQSIETASEGNKKDLNSDKSSSLFLQLCEAARTQSGHHLANLAQKITPKYVWEDLILPNNQMRQLKEMCQEIQYQNLVHQQWGFAAKLSLGKGLNVLFSGASGTGKTMAAEVIANELQLDLYKIDLSQIVSKYIGETEKNLNQIFTAAAQSNAILLFDEADALFGKRSDVQDARDRYANIEVGYLLQKMEEYEGIAILTTNLRSNMDPAFERRLRFIIEFYPPDVKHRYLIWQNIFPKNTPCHPELNLEFLAENFELTGANIRNIALTAAFLAANDDRIIKMTHLIQAIRREYQKMGQVLRDRDLGEYGG